MHPPSPVFGTFGIYRFILALLVVTTHSYEPQFIYMGQYAVFAFYMLSGYIVSYILHTTYLPRQGGLALFAVNRLLRIYPAYLLVLVFALLLAAHYPMEAKQMYGTAYPRDAADWLANITSIGIVDIQGKFSYGIALLVGWSLGVELMFWAIIPLMFLSRPVRVGVTCFAVCYTVIMAAQHAAYGLRFLSPLAAALPFCAGFWLFQAKLRSHHRVPPLALITAVIFFAVVHLYAGKLFSNIEYSGFYAAMLSNCLLIICLSHIDQRTLPAWLKQWDDRLGDVTYAIYLVHIPLIICLNILLPTYSRSLVAYILAVILSILVAIALHRCIERPINSLKRQLKSAP